MTAQVTVPLPTQSLQSRAADQADRPVEGSTELGGFGGFGSVCLCSLRGLVCSFRAPFVREEESYQPTWMSNTWECRCADRSS